MICSSAIAMTLDTMHVVTIREIILQTTSTIAHVNFEGIVKVNVYI
jgi:hypothetical protein